VSAQFGFLRADFAEQHEIAVRVERYALDDPGTSIIHARRALESAVKWVYDNDTSLAVPYDDSLNALLHEPAFRQFEDGKVFDLARRIQKVGNQAVHESKAPTSAEAIQIASALHLVLYWLAFRYGRTKPEPGRPFDPNLLPHDDASVVDRDQSNLAARQELEVRLAEEAADAEAARAELAAANQTLAEVEAERARLLAEVTAARLAADAQPEGSIDWSEATTRTKLIDLYLGEAGWTLTDERDREFEVTGMPFGSGIGYVDYVLWGADGLPLAVVEAKKSRTSEQAGKHQAVLYADCLEAMTGRRPVIYYTNGYTHWLWNDTSQPPRKVQGFHTRDELELMIQRRTTTVPTSTLDIDDAVVERSYQHRAIRAITDHFEIDGQRKALVVMATGAGKTRVVIALCDLLMRAGLVRRALFLADRTALVDQAVGAFKEHLPNVSTVNLTTEPNEDGRVYVSTYQTMVGKIDEMRHGAGQSGGTRRFGVGHFDLVIIDEAHRSVYRKYRGIFDYFDSYLVGLTATPRDEIDTNTYDLFDLETGVPTDSYSLDDAIDDGYLVPPANVSVPMQFVREGIRYEDRTEEEKEQWEEFDWGVGDDGLPLEMPAEVSSGELNKFLFNEDTVDKVLEYLMTHGIRVAGGERLGKTIVFAKNQRHADYICERFDANYPNHAGKFARVITHDVNYAKDLIEKFKMPDKAPHIAISVDMLDTGIDVPEVVNLVFFKLVRSKTKFWQMIGRGTRLSPDLFGLGHNKAEFRVFDFCQNLEYFSQPMVPSTASGVVSLSERIFTTRLDLLGRLDALDSLDDERDEIAGILRERLASMNDDNFLVRPHLELVERFRGLAAWEHPDHAELAALRSDIARLPDQLDPEHEDAKRFDVLVLNAQLATLGGEPFERERTRIVRLASGLEDIGHIPAVAHHLALIQAVQADEWWVDASYQMLEDVRCKLRLLIPLIERIRRGQVFSDFEDTIGEGERIVLPGTGGAGGGTTDFAQFRRKAESFLRDHLGEAAVAKVRSGEPLSSTNVADLQRILVAAGIGDDESFAEASERAGNFGRFVRGLVGLDRAAAKAAFNAFLDDRRYTRKQIEFVEIVINELADQGVVEAGRFYESPYSGLAPTGPEDLFSPADLDDLFAQLEAMSAVMSDGDDSGE
jgi:type I restriction enzyme R subunit